MNPMIVCHCKLTEVLPNLAEIVKRDPTQWNSLRNPFESIQSLNEIFDLLSSTIVAENEGILENVHTIFEAGASTLLIIADAYLGTSVGTSQDAGSIHSIICTAFPTLTLPAILKLDFDGCPSRIENSFHHLNIVKDCVESISQLLIFFKDIFFTCRVANSFYRDEFTTVSTVLISALSVMEGKANELKTNKDTFSLAFIIAVDKPFKMSLNALWLLFKIPELNLPYDVVFAACKLILKVLFTTLGSLRLVLEFYLRDSYDSEKDEIIKVIKEVQEASKHVLDTEMRQADCDSMCINVERNSPSNSALIPTDFDINESRTSTSIRRIKELIDGTAKVPSADSNRSNSFCENVFKKPSISSVKSAICNESQPTSSVISSNSTSQQMSPDVCDKSVQKSNKEIPLRSQRSNKTHKSNTRERSSTSQRANIPLRLNSSHDLDFLKRFNFSRTSNALGSFNPDQRFINQRFNYYPQSFHLFQKSYISQNFDFYRRFHASQRCDFYQRFNVLGRYNTPRRFKTPQRSKTLKKSSSQNSCLMAKSLQEKGNSRNKGNSRKKGHSRKIGNSVKEGKSGKEGNSGNEGKEGKKEHKGKEGNKGKEGDKGKEGKKEHKGKEGNKGKEGDKGKEGKEGNKEKGEKSTLNNVCHSSVTLSSSQPKAQTLFHPDRSPTCKDLIPELLSEVIPSQDSRSQTFSSSKGCRIPVVITRCPSSAQAVDINAVSPIKAAVPSLNNGAEPINSSS